MAQIKILGDTFEIFESGTLNEKEKWCSVKLREDNNLIIFETPSFSVEDVRNYFSQEDHFGDPLVKTEDFTVAHHRISDVIIISSFLDYDELISIIKGAPF